MRCQSCHALSLEAVCIRCKERLLSPTVSKRNAGTLEVISLFRYSTIEPFLLSKHTAAGFRIYRYFSKTFFKPFLAEFAGHLDEPVTLIGIDEQVTHGYSHTAVLSHYAAQERIEPAHATLLAHNPVSYAGKPLQYRLDHPRDFRYTGQSGLEVILIDDIITTGITLQQAQQELEQHDVEVLFALTLADARG